MKSGEASAASGRVAMSARRSMKAIWAVRRWVQPVLVQQHEIDLAKVDRMVEMLEQGGELPPVVVATYGAKLLPIDGHHRLEAHARLNRMLEAWCITGRAYDGLCVRHRNPEQHIICDGVPAMEVAERWRASSRPRRVLEWVGPDHQVVSFTRDRQSGRRVCRSEPCRKCPWRVDAVGEFPSEAFRVSAKTSYDMSTAVFSCHDSGSAKPAICAGFLLRGADHNLSIRLAHLRGDLPEVRDGGHALHENYRAMAVANGVEPDDPSLEGCR